MILGPALILAAVWFLNQYYMPEAVAQQYAEENGLEWPPGGLEIPFGIANPVLIALGTALVMTFIATRRRFGRYVYSIGGNPEAAQLSGIKTKRIIMLTFMVMGLLVGLAAAVQIARLNSATAGLGTLQELSVIAAAVIGGTSLSGGVGTVFGAVLGALFMQSLQSGMVLVGIQTATQDVVVGSGPGGSGGSRRRLPETTGTMTCEATAPSAGGDAGHECQLRRRPCRRRRQHRSASRRDPGPGRGERRRQVDSDQDTLRGADGPTSGTILVDGEPVEIHTPIDAKKWGIETIYQTLALADNIDAPGNMFLGRELTTRFGNLDDSVDGGRHPQDHGPSQSQVPELQGRR